MYKIQFDKSIEEIIRKEFPEKDEADRLINYLANSVGNLTVPRELYKLMECEEERIAKFIKRIKEDGKSIEEICSYDSQLFLWKFCLYMHSDIDYFNNNFKSAMNFKFAQMVLEFSNIKDVEEYSSDKYIDEAYYNKESDENELDDCPNWIICIYYKDGKCEELIYNIVEDDYEIKRKKNKSVG